MQYLDIEAGRLAYASGGTTPITAAEAKRHCYVSGTDQDDDFDRWIVAAKNYAELKTKRSFINTTWDYTLDRFPPDDWGILLPRPPLSSVTSITYTDEAGNTGQTFSSADYVVSTDHEPGRITLAYGESWPNTYEEADCIVIRFVAGYGASGSNVPEEFRDDMLRYVLGYFKRISPDEMTALKRELFTSNPLIRI